MDSTQLNRRSKRLIGKIRVRYHEDIQKAKAEMKADADRIQAEIDKKKLLIINENRQHFKKCIEEYCKNHNIQYNSQYINTILDAYTESDIYYRLTKMYICNLTINESVTAYMMSLKKTILL